MSRFLDDVVIVTGAGSGIGYEAAARFRAEGAVVVAADVQPDQVPEATETVHADVTKPEDVHALVQETMNRHGRVDILVNNAGIGSTTDLLGCSVPEWDQVFAVNVRGPFLCMQAVLPDMLSRGKGVIVNVASVAGKIGLRDRAAYCASKGALIAHTKQVAVQWADAGIRCNAVCPGTVDSPWVGRLLSEAPDPEQRRRDLVARQPMGRLGQPAEIAQAILFLSSEDAAFMTGSELVIDGGIHAG